MDFDRRACLSLLAASLAGCSTIFGRGGTPDAGNGQASTPADDQSTPVTMDGTTADREEGSTAEPSPVGAWADGKIVLLGADLDVGVVDPASTDTPIQDALDVVGPAGGGRIFLPPETIRERGPIRPYTNVGLYGAGMNVSVVKITDEDVDGVRLDRTPSLHRVRLDGFELRGPGLDRSSGAAIHHVDTGETDTADFSVGRLYLREWTDAVYRVDEGNGPYQCRHDYLRADDCDAGAANALVDWQSTYGPANVFGTIVAYPVATYSGHNTRTLVQKGGELSIGYVTLGGTAGQVIDHVDGQLTVDRIHWEPTDQRSIPHSLVRLGGDNAAVINDVVPDTGTVDYVYELAAGAGRKRLGFGKARVARIREGVVEVAGRPADAPSWYFGTRDEVDVTHGGPERGRLRVLGTAGVGVG